MEFPVLLKSKINDLCNQVSTAKLVNYSQQLTSVYRDKNNTNNKALKSNELALVYAAVRMPATFGAVSSAIDKICEIKEFNIKSMLDVGAGTGTCGWAASQFFELDNLICLEREDVMRSLGHDLMKCSEDKALVNSKWNKFDLIKDENLPTADLVTASYLINELPSANDVIMKLWRSTKQVLLIVEPGTPDAFANLLKVRDLLIREGAYIVAPCPHDCKCPLSKNDWCHFSARISRTRLHRQLKSADMGYEDEKYCYMAFSKEQVSFKYNRILKTPKITKPEIVMDICDMNGENKMSKISIREKDTYKRCKKLNWGDILS